MRKLWTALLLVALLAVGPAAAQLPLMFQITGPAGSVPLTASTTGTTGQITATLTGASGQYTYVCGFAVSSSGTTASVGVNVTVSGTIGGTLNFAYNYVSTGQGLLGISFGPNCITSSSQNTSITLTLPAGGTGTVNAATVWGYRL